MDSKTTVWHSSYKSGYDVPLFFLSGTGVHIPYHIDNCERGFLYVPDKLKKFVTADNLTSIVKELVNRNLNFVLCRDGFPCTPETKLADICTENNQELIIKAES